MSISVFSVLPPATRDTVALTTIPSMNVISHAIEDIVLDLAAPGVLFVGFQRISYFLRQETRYRELAAHCAQIVVCATLDVPPPRIPNITFVPLNPDADLTREWFIIAHSSQFTTALIARELDRPNPAAPRNFAAAWTYDRAVVERAAALIGQLAGVAVESDAPRDVFQQQVRMMQIARRLLERQEVRATQQAERRHHAALLSAALESTGTALLLVDTHTTVVAATPGAAQLLGVAAELVVEQPLSVVGGHGLINAVTGGRDALTNTVLTTAGARTLRAASRQITDANGNLIGWVVALVDATATERGALLQLVRSIQPQIQELREIAVLLPEFRAREDWQRLLSRNMTRIADQLTARLQRLELLQQMSTETVSFELSIDLIELVHELIETFRPHAEGRGVTLRAETISEAQIFGDPGRLRLALHELVQNALNATAANGCVTVGVTQQGTYLALKVKDTGHGIPLAQQSQIFEPFYRRADPDVMTSGGLGLALVCAVIQSHAGYVGVESIPASGTDVTLLLPIQPASALYLRTV